MKKLLNWTLGPLVIGGLLAAGCEEGDVDVNPFAKKTPPFGTPVAAGLTNVKGYAIDPETFWFTFAMCQAQQTEDDPCFFGFVETNNPNGPLDLANLPGAVVNLFDTTTATLFGTSSDPVGDDGIWTIPAVPSGTSPAYLAMIQDYVPPPFVEPDGGVEDGGAVDGGSDGGSDGGADGGSTKIAVPTTGLRPTYDPETARGIRGGWGAMRSNPGAPFRAPKRAELDLVFPPPPTTFFPTFSLKPIVPNFTYCLNQPAFVIGDNGILEAAAKFLTEVDGLPTTSADLLDPAKFGGVVIWWAYQPTWKEFRIPGAGFNPDTFEVTGTTVSTNLAEARVLNLNWLPPGSLPDAIQSARGFFVQDGPVSDLGLTITLLPATASATTDVEFAGVDPTENPGEICFFQSCPRPWQYPATSVAVQPGVVYFGEYLPFADETLFNVYDCSLDVHGLQ